MPIRIPVPQVNKWDVGGGVQKILAATHRAATTPEPLILDFAGCSFLSAEATALLASIFLDRKRRGFSTELNLAFVHADVGRHLDRTGLLWLCETGAGLSPSGSSLPLLTTEVLDRERILRYIDQELMGREQMPTMTARLQKDIRQAFFEVIGNIFYHSGSPIGAIVCGQIYPKANEIQVTFLDRGVGVAAKVRSCVNGIDGDGRAIGWALRRGTSTLATASLSRGLGLFLLREFIRANGGQFRIYANGAYLEETRGTPSRGSLDPPLKGTLVDLRIKIRWDVRYGFPDDFQN
jgi:anti-sigma regulatory factor (Ser/Thr protein kinase)